MAVLPHEGTYPVMYGTASIPVGSGYRLGYLTRPDRTGLFPALVIVAGLGGITSHTKGLARRTARRGLVTVALDVGAELAGGPAGDETVVRILDETHEYLDSPDIGWVHPDSIGVLGLGAGGRAALLAAANRRWVGAVAVVSTPLGEDPPHQIPDLLGRLTLPVLGLYGTADPTIPIESVDDAQRRNPGGTWLLYPEAGHRFIDETSDDYSEPAAEDAIARLTQFFVEALPDPVEQDLG